MENITKVLGLARIRINLASYDSAPNFQWVKRVMLVENVVLFISLCSDISDWYFWNFWLTSHSTMLTLKVNTMRSWMIASKNNFQSQNNECNLRGEIPIWIILHCIEIKLFSSIVWAELWKQNKLNQMNLQFLSDPSLTIVSHSISQFLLLLRLDWCAHGAWRSMQPLLVVPIPLSNNALGPLCAFGNDWLFS